jgi:DNA-binding transcriptional regulator YiaG
MPHDARAFVALGAEPIGDDGRQWIEIMPTADKAKNGPWLFTIDDSDLETYAAHIRANAGKIAIDRDHDTDEGRSSRAAGWFVGEAEVRDGEDGKRLWALVEWTKSGLEDVQNKEFRFISPVFNFHDRDAKTGPMTKAREILRATLTNNPFFKQLAPVTAADLEPESPLVLTLARNLGRTPEEIVQAAQEASTVWDARFGLEGIRERLYASLNPGREISDFRYWIMDVSVAGTAGRALVRENSTQATWVVPYEITSRGDVTAGARDEWVEARQEWVKASEDALAHNQNAVRSDDELAAELKLRRQLPSRDKARWLRVSAGMSADQLAETCGVTGDTVRSWESGTALPAGPALGRYVTALQQFEAPS